MERPDICRSCFSDIPFDRWTICTAGAGQAGLHFQLDSHLPEGISAFHYRRCFELADQADTRP